MVISLRELGFAFELLDGTFGIGFPGVPASDVFAVFLFFFGDAFDFGVCERPASCGGLESSWWVE